MRESVKNKTDEELYYSLYDESCAREAFDEIYIRYSSKVYTYCVRVLSDTALAEDIFQETFLRLYESIKVPRNMTNFSAFLFKIARNLCLNEKQRKHHTFVPLEDFTLPIMDENFDDKEMIKLLELAMDALPGKMKEVLIYKEYFDLTYREIADIMNSSLPAVRIRIFRAKEKLRELLAPYIREFEK